MSINNSFKRLINLGFSPKTILDIGAYKGHWTLNAKRFFPQAKFFMVEAIEYEELKYMGETCFFALLKDKIEEVDWYEERNTGDSIYKEKTKFFKNTKPIKKTSTTLDNILFYDIDLIKIDCQGAELDILAGGKEIAEKAEVIILELPFVGEYNLGAPVFLEYINYMNKIGFKVFDISEHHYIDEILVQVDFVFVNEQSDILKKIDKIIEKIH
jgi:FkbM family methyltransferase